MNKDMIVSYRVACLSSKQGGTASKARPCIQGRAFLLEVLFCHREAINYDYSHEPVIYR